MSPNSEPKYFTGIDIAPVGYRARGEQTAVTLIRVNPDGTREILACPEHVRQSVIDSCMRDPETYTHGGDFLLEDV